MAERIAADGETWMSGSRWRGQAALRISVRNWVTNEADVGRTVEAIRRACAS